MDQEQDSSPPQAKFEALNPENLPSLNSFLLADYQKNEQQQNFVVAPVSHSSCDQLGDSNFTEKIQEVCEIPKNQVQESIIGEIEASTALIDCSTISIKDPDPSSS